MKVLLLIDEKLSSKNQCEALAEAISNKIPIIVKYIYLKNKLLDYLPNMFIYYYLYLLSFFTETNEEFDFIISCGRKTAAFSIIKKKSNTINIHILDPYILRNRFDQIIVPEHDKGKLKVFPNITYTKGALTKIKKTRFNTRKKKYICCLIGGSGKSSKIIVNNILKLVKDMNSLSKKNYIVTYFFSRRTPLEVKSYICNNKNSCINCYPNKNQNPYYEFLNKSNYFFVTEDSIGMISDILTTGRPLYLIEVLRVKSKIKLFSKTLIKQGFARKYNNCVKEWSYKPFNESQRVANLIINSYIE
tara:strand:- start:48 stop:956 length:909 start_codon:yes stop_codon:yes gene_type:complete